MNEIAKLPSGVAVVYQNDWVAPVLTMIDKAAVKERPYVADRKTTIRTVSSARILILRMLMQPWIGEEKIDEQSLKDSLKVLDVSRGAKKRMHPLCGNCRKVTNPPIGPGGRSPRSSVSV